MFFQIWFCFWYQMICCTGETTFYGVLNFYFGCFLYLKYPIKNFSCSLLFFSVLATSLKTLQRQTFYCIYLYSIEAGIYFYPTCE